MRFAALLIGLALLAGCGVVISDEVPADSDLSEVGSAGAPCSDDWFPTVPTTPVPKDFTPVSVTRCVRVVEPIEGNGEWLMDVDQRADSQLDSLMQALRLKSAGRAIGACPAIAVAPIILTLTDANGVSITPEIPRGGCGFPLPAVVRAVKAMPWTATKQTKLRQLRTQVEIDSNCPGDYKPVVALAADSSTHKVAAVGPAMPDTGAIQICRYGLNPAEKLTDPFGHERLAGKLASVAMLTGDRQQRLLRALAAAPAVTTPCDKPQPEFAVIFPFREQGPWIAVELGGCLRMLDKDDALHQLDEATVALLK